MSSDRSELLYLPLDHIQVSKFNVRHTNPEEGIEDLAESIRTIGVQQPVVVLRTPEEGRYDLIVGPRRYLASKIAGVKEIPALVLPEKSRKEALIISFSENIHRLDLEYRDKMQVTMELMNELQSVEAVAKHLGVSIQTVRNYLGYAGVPEQIKQMVEQGQLGATTALRIAWRIPDEDQAVKVAQKARELPRAAQRKQLIDVAAEHPEASVQRAAVIAKQQEFRKVEVHVTDRLSVALDAACREYRASPDHIALDALEEWLTKRGFIE